MRGRSRAPRQWRFWLSAGAVAVVVVTGLVVIISGLRVSPAAQVRPVLVLSGHWPPYAGQDLEEGGPAVAMLTDVLELAGYQPEVHFTTWSSATGRVVEGSAFGAYPLVSSAAREQTMTFSDPVIEFEYVLFHRVDTPEPRDAAGLDAMRVGGIEGYDYWPEFDEAVGEITVFATTREAMAALAAGDVDVVAEGHRSGLAALADPTLDADASTIAVVSSDAPWARSTQALYFTMADRPEADAVMTQFNEALATYRSTDEYAALEAQIDGAADSVVLLPRPDSGLVALRDSTGFVVRHSPQGTTATVLEWPAAMDQGALDGANLLVRVKVTNGPAAGLIYFVDAGDVMLEVS